MSDLQWNSLFGWTLLIVVVYPLLTVCVAEWSRRLDDEDTALRRSLRVVQFLLLPSFAVWLVVDRLTDLPNSSLPVKLVETAFGISVLYTLLVFAQGALTIVAAHSRAPRLLYDIALTVLVVIGGAIIISIVWGFSLASLLSAVGVGSVVMGLALQNVIGGMVSGLLLLSARQFNIGDWLRAGGAVGRITQLDWRSVTLQVSPTERLVLPSASLSAGSFSVMTADQPTVAATNVIIRYEHSPEKVRTVLLEAARSVPQLVETNRANCWVAEYTATGIRYGVSVAVSDPGRTVGALDELLSRIWYVGQRHGMSVVPAGTEPAGNNLPEYGVTTEQRAQLLADSGAFRRRPEVLTEIAEAARLQRWRANETIVQQGAPVNVILVVLHGVICISTQSGTVRRELDSLAAGQVFAIREAFRGAACPVQVVASEETELLAVPAPAMQHTLDGDPALAAELENILEIRTQALLNLNTPLADSTA